VISRCLLLAVLVAWTGLTWSTGPGTGTDVETGAADATETVDENPCAGMSDGELMGAEACEECHEDKVAGMRMNVHGQAADARTPFAKDECETCHGPGTTHFDVEGNCIISLRGRFGESVQQRNGICLNCHSRDMLHWQGSRHESEDLACTSCHDIHGEGAVLDRTTQTEVCYRCHEDIRAQTYRMSTHPIRASKVVCSDCHNPHGSPGPSALQKLSVNDTCYTCHAEKRGPFLWEHYPVTEDCTLCHAAHGSNHAPLLNRQRPQLCQQCHADIRAQGRRHVRRFLDFDDSDPNRGRFIVGESCQNCHSQVHGSNHPSGANLLR
jgi:DmsE family decaheme c-type cytochrome